MDSRSHSTPPTPPAHSDAASDASIRGAGTRRREVFAFLALAVFIWPFIAVGVVGGFGFVVWTGQMIFGPPGPPGQ